MSALWEIFSAVVGGWFGEKVARIFSTNYRNDPVYKKKARELIERNRRFEKAE
jgi:hypothetical protein